MFNIIPFVYLTISVCALLSIIVISTKQRINKLLYSTLYFIFLMSSSFTLINTGDRITVILLILTMMVVCLYFYFYQEAKGTTQNPHNFLELTNTLFGFLFLFIVFPDTDKWIVSISILLFGTADFIANIAEIISKGKRFKWASESKSVLGSSAFAVSLFAGLLLWGYFADYLPPMKDADGFIISNPHYAVSLIIVLITSLFKGMTSKGFDKYLIPVIISFFIFLFIKNYDKDLLYTFLLGLSFAFLVASVSYKVKFLTLDGAIATFLLAGFIFGLGGFKWSVPMLSFFILSSVLSKLRKNVNEDVETYFEKTGVRDRMQVAANGGIGGVLVIFNAVRPNELFYLVYLSTLAAVCADTWATEIGTWRKTATYNILNLKPTIQGLSGGISLPGTIGAFLGAFVISLSGIVWINLNAISYILLIILAGVAGSFFDSFLGATIQAQHKCNVCEKLTEKTFHCGVKTIHFKGYSWINNDAVNLFSGFAGAGVILLFKSLVNL